MSELIHFILPLYILQIAVGEQGSSTKTGTEGGVSDLSRKKIDTNTRIIQTLSPTMQQLKLLSYYIQESIQHIILFFELYTTYKSSLPLTTGSGANSSKKRTLVC